MTTKILALADALGNLVRFVLLPGHRFDTIGVPPLFDGIEFGALIADKAFDSNAIVADLDERGAKIVISQHPRRTKPLPLDAVLVRGGLASLTPGGEDPTGGPHPEDAETIGVGHQYHTCPRTNPPRIPRANATTQPMAIRIMKPPTMITIGSLVCCIVGPL